MKIPAFYVGSFLFLQTIREIARLFINHDPFDFFKRTHAAAVNDLAVGSGQTAVSFLIFLQIHQIHKYAGIFVSRKLSLTYDGISESVLTDEKWLGFVIGQILSNALKYTRTGGIRISLKDVPGNSQNTEDISNMISPSPVTLIIEDTGIGIRKEDLPRIFEKGYTGVNGRENNRATGIGLYLSKKIMKRLGHRIYVTSEEGKGTKVFLEFSQNVLTMY